MNLRNHLSACACIAALLCGIAMQALRAQSFDDRKARAGITIGPGFSGGASMVTEAQEGHKVKPVFAWRAETGITFPLTEVMNANVTLGIDGRGTQTHLETTDEFYTNYYITYFTIYPQFTFSGFSLGFNFGLPLAVSSSSDFSPPTVDVDDASVMLEPRIGAVLPLVDEDVGWLSLIIGGGYAINDFLEERGRYIGLKESAGVSAHLGVRFEFLIPGTERTE